VAVEEVPGGFQVTDDRLRRIHFLNATAALVLHLCDGVRTPEQMAVAIAELYALAEPPDAHVRMCLDELNGEGLLLAAAER
jgi:hypothetical protein